jgi:hypothetical protein
MYILSTMTLNLSKIEGRRKKEREIAWVLISSTFIMKTFKN